MQDFCGKCGWSLLSVVALFGAFFRLARGVRQPELLRDELGYV
jgi:hypothetical protein